MTKEKLKMSISVDSYPSEIFLELSKQRTFEKGLAFCNVVLILQDKSVHLAHKCVLAAASTYFEDVIKDKRFNKVPVLELELDIMTSAVGKAVVDFFYTGNLDLENGNFTENEICSAVELLQLKKISLVEIKHYYRRKEIEGANIQNNLKLQGLSVGQQQPGQGGGPGGSPVKLSEHLQESANEIACHYVNSLATHPATSSLTSVTNVDDRILTSTASLTSNTETTQILAAPINENNLFENFQKDPLEKEETENSQMSDHNENLQLNTINLNLNNNNSNTDLDFQENNPVVKTLLECLKNKLTNKTLSEADVQNCDLAIGHCAKSFVDAKGDQEKLAQLLKIKIQEFTAEAEAAESEKLNVNVNELDVHDQNEQEYEHATHGQTDPHLDLDGCKTTPKTKHFTATQSPGPGVKLIIKEQDLRQDYNEEEQEHAININDFEAHEVLKSDSSTICTTTTTTSSTHKLTTELSETDPPSTLAPVLEQTCFTPQHASTGAVSEASGTCSEEEQINENERRQLELQAARTFTMTHADQNQGPESSGIQSDANSLGQGHGPLSSLANSQWANPYSGLNKDSLQNLDAATLASLMELLQKNLSNSGSEEYQNFSISGKFSLQADAEGQDQNQTQSQNLPQTSETANPLSCFDPIASFHQQQSSNTSTSSIFPDPNLSGPSTTTASGLSAAQLANTFYHRNHYRENKEGYHMPKSSQFKPDEVAILHKVGMTVQDLNDPQKFKSVKTKGKLTAEEELVFKRMSRREKCRQSAINYRNSQRRKKKENEVRLNEVTIENLKCRERIKELIFRLKGQRAKLNLDLLECQADKERILNNNEVSIRNAEFLMIEGQQRMKTQHLNHLPALNRMSVLETLNYTSET